jgi:hypothetical protein
MLINAFKLFFSILQHIFGAYSSLEGGDLLDWSAVPVRVKVTLDVCCGLDATNAVAGFDLFAYGLVGMLVHVFVGKV